MIISKAIRYFAERLGIKTTGTGISDAIVDLADNFPFGKETKEVVVLSSQSVTGGSPNYGVYTKDSINLNSSIEVGKAYKVVFNDEEYKLTARTENNAIGFSNSESYVLGNTQTLPNDAFALFIKNGYTVLQWNSVFASKTITIAIYEEIETITTLPAEFLPEEIQRVGGDVELTSPNGTKYKLSVADDGTLSAVTV